MVEKQDIHVKTISDHYESLSKNFNRFWYYTEDFVSKVTLDIQDALKLTNKDVFADIGCGSGLYTLRLLERANELPKVTICVDTSRSQLDQIPDLPNLVKVEGDALLFLKSVDSFDKALLKEVLHHIKSKKELVELLSQKLNKHGTILIIISPAKVKYPLFKKALALRNKGRSVKNSVAQIMKENGLDVIVKYKKYIVNVEKKRYLEMVEGRYMSFLSLLSDSEIKTGVLEMESKLKDHKKVSFLERYIFILGIKK